MMGKIGQHHCLFSSLNIMYTVLKDAPVVYNISLGRVERNYIELIITCLLKYGDQQEAFLY